MGQIKWTPIRLDRGIYAWALVLMIVFVAQVSNFMFQFLLDKARELLNFYSFVVVAIGMLSIWITSWHVDAKEPKGVAYNILLWLNFLIFSILAILLFVNPQQSLTTSAVAIISITSVGNIGASVYAMMGKFERNVDVVDNIGYKCIPTRISSSIYYWVVTMIVVFYVIVLHHVFNLLPEEIYNFISFTSFVFSLWFMLSVARKNARMKWEASDLDTKAVSGSIIKWAMVVSVTLLWNRLVVDIVEPSGVLYNVSVIVSSIVNSIFLVLLLLGKFRVRN